MVLKSVQVVLSQKFTRAYILHFQLKFVIWVNFNWNLNWIFKKFQNTLLSMIPQKKICADICNWCFEVKWEYLPSILKFTFSSWQTLQLHIVSIILILTGSHGQPVCALSFLFIRCFICNSIWFRIVHFITKLIYHCLLVQKTTFKPLNYLYCPLVFKVC